MVSCGRGPIKLPNSDIIGMGNRFRELSQYHKLILAHGVIAAITFLLIVPSAIMIVRFQRNRSRAIRHHIWLQILTVLLATVIIILGFMAVGPERSLTNPHHGIGVAIYVLIIVQVLGGALIRRRQRKNKSQGLLKTIVSSRGSLNNRSKTDKLVASSLARANSRYTWNCSSCSRDNTLRLSQSPVRFVYLGGICTTSYVFYSHIPRCQAWRKGLR